mgnify:CR=1 FL=1
MEELSELDAARMVTFIYGKELPSLIESVRKKLGDNFTVGDVVALIKQDPDAIIINNENKGKEEEQGEEDPEAAMKEGENAGEEESEVAMKEGENAEEDQESIIEKRKNVGAEMSLEEYEEVLNQIEQSETLMSMQIKNFVNEEDTDFRALTLVDPNNKIKPMVVFRGTAGDYQWADNFSGLFSSRTPAQMRAQQYVVNSGYDHVTVAGHSKGGNMAAVVAYMLPEGMVDIAYSFDGQGVSDAFLDYISDSRKENALNRIQNINEYRDIVSLLLNRTGRISNTKYIDSGVLFDDTAYAEADFLQNLKMSLFHAHKPNYFLLPEACERLNRYRPNGIYDGMHLFTNIVDNFSDHRDGMIGITKAAAEFMYTSNSYTEWSDEMWNAVYDAEKIYDRIRNSRTEKILAQLEEIMGMDMKEKLLIQPEGSLVVEGAVLTCQYCSGIGSLAVTEEREDLIQGKRVAVKTDNKKENIQMDALECSRIDWNAEKAESRECKPDVCSDWLLTDPDKLRGPRGEEAILKKSVLGCMRGGMIEIVHNGQLDGADAGEVIQASEREKSEATKVGEFTDSIKSLIQQNFHEYYEEADSSTSKNAIEKWLFRKGEKAVESITDPIQNKFESDKQRIAKQYENWLKFQIEQQLKRYNY